MTLQGFSKFRDEPMVQDIRSDVLKYNKVLQSFGIRDHEVMDTEVGPALAIMRLLLKVSEIIILTFLAAPG